VIRSAGALIQAIGCTTPNAYSELCDLSVIFIATKPVDWMCSAAIIGALAITPGRAFVNGAFIFPIAIGTDKVYIIDCHFLARCWAVVSNDGKVPRVIEAYGIGACFAVLDRVIVLAGAPVYIGNILAFFFSTGAAVVGCGAIDAILRQSLVAELCCGIALQSEGLAGYLHRRTGIVVKRCR
jgi:hypothetical protein